MSKNRNPYLNYFACLLAGIFVAESLSPKMRDATLFEKFLMLGVTTYGGALMGTYLYKLSFLGIEKCPCGCCIDNDSDSEE